jgi:L-alanine-DL-glutamate epimerase-like enolase superfamily enzyme
MMKISEVIKKLAAIEKEHGDIDVFIDDFEGWSRNDITEIEIANDIEDKKIKWVVIS